MKAQFVVDGARYPPRDVDGSLALLALALDAVVYRGQCWRPSPDRLPCDLWVQTARGWMWVWSGSLPSDLARCGEVVEDQVQDWWERCLLARLQAC